MKWILRKFFLVWAKTGIAPGLLHKYVDQYSSALASKPLERRLAGNNTMLCDLEDHVQSRIFFLGAYEPIEVYLFSHLVKPGMHIVDAGANVGFYSLQAASKLAGQGKVYAFEPVPSNFKKLQNNVDKSSRTEIEIIKEGLWHKEEDLEFSLAEDQANNHGSFTVGDNHSSSSTFQCHVNTLDSHTQNRIPKVDLIKMDIEGAEFFALQGAEQSLKRFLPTILIEINQSACEKLGYKSQKIDELLLPLGYKIFRVNSTPDQSGFIDNTQDIGQGNVFFVSPKHLNSFLTHWDYRSIRKYYASF